jgi:phosphate-selective porin
VEGAYTLTGERRDYRGRAGVFDGISPKRPLGRGGYGAVEVAARFSSTDLQDETLGGDTGTVLGAGVNWYPRDDLKVSLGGQRVERERIRRGMARPDVEDTVVQMRLQANF